MCTMIPNPALDTRQSVEDHDGHHLNLFVSLSLFYQERDTLYQNDSIISKSNNSSIIYNESSIVTDPIVVATAIS